jgi:hypothetical protein
VTKVDFLGHRITQEGLKMDDHKVKAILDWEPLRSISALRSFLGFASYYHEFIKKFVKITMPLTNFWRNHPKLMNGACNETFETLKGIFVKAFVLKFPTLTKILKSTLMPLTL